MSDLGPDHHKCTDFLLHCRGHTLLVQRMLEHLKGGDGQSDESSVVHSLLHAEDSKGYTALHLAAKHRDRDTAKLLLDWGVNPSAKCKEGQTALDVLPHEGEESTQVRFLLKEAAGKLFFMCYSCITLFAFPQWTWTAWNM